MEKPRLLLVEDNPTLSAALRSFLRKDFLITQAPTLKNALAELEQIAFDIILLDRMLPDGDGADILSMLKTIAPSTKICILSMQANLPERVRGLYEGADVYLAKPFQFTELRAYLDSLLRRGKIQNGSIIQRDGLRFDMDRRVLVYHDCAVILSDRESQLFRLFLDTSDDFVTLQALHDWLWQHGLPTSSSLIHMSIQRLKRKLKQVHGTIRSHYGAGYEMKFEP